MGRRDGSVSAIWGPVNPPRPTLVDEPILGRVVLGLERPKQRLFRTENLDRARGLLGEVHEASRVRDQSRADELADKRSEVGRDRSHAVAEVLGELGAVLGDADHLVAQRVDVLDVGVGDFGAHRELGGSLEGRFEVLGEDEREVGRRGVGAEACARASAGCQPVRRAV